MSPNDPEFLAVLQRKADEMRAQLAQLEKMIAEFGGTSDKNANRLITGAQHGNMPTMNDAHRTSLSEAKANDPFSTAVRAAGFPSVNKFAAEKIGISSTFLFAAHKGQKAIRESVCITVRDALGMGPDGKWLFPATQDNWPKIKLGK
jgi:sirohydrochlorin ferrochelatase